MEKEHYCLKMSRGYCHITDSEVLFSRESNIKHVTVNESFMSQYGIKIYRLLLIPVFIFIGYKNYGRDDNFGLYFYLFLITYLIISTSLTLKYSLKQKIDRETISHVTFQEAIAGVRLARFVIHFQDRGKRKMRLVPMPSKLAGGDAKTASALEAMKESGLYDKASENADIIDAI